jgi:hypothetical protein
VDIQNEDESGSFGVKNECVELFSFYDSDWATSMDDIKKVHSDIYLLLGRVYFHGYQRNKKE